MPFIVAKFCKERGEVFFVRFMQYTIKLLSHVAVFLLVMLLSIQAVRIFCSDDDSPYLPSYKEPVAVSTVARKALTPLYSFERPEKGGAVSAASEYLALAWQGTLKVYSLKTGSPVFSGHYGVSVKNDDSADDRVFCSLSPQGSFCALAPCPSKEVIIHEVRTGECAARLPVKNARAVTWSDMGDLLLTVSEDMLLQIWSVDGWKELSHYDLAAGKCREYSRDLSLDMVHMMPDNNTIYYNVQWGRGSGWFFGLDRKSGRVKELDSYGYSEPGVLSTCFSPGSQYLCRVQFYPPGEGTIDIGTIVKYGPSELKPIPLFHAFGIYSSTSMASMGTYLAYSYSAFSRRDRQYEKVLEMLQLRNNHAYRIPLGEYEGVRSLHFSWYKSFLIVDWGDLSTIKRTVEVFDPRQIEEER